MVGLALLFETLFFLFEPRRIVAFPWDAVAAVEFENPTGDIVEKIAVVGHGNHGALVVAEKAFEPSHRFGVEVIGRLVQQQDIRALQQEPAQGHAPALATR